MVKIEVDESGSFLRANDFNENEIITVTVTGEAEFRDVELEDRIIQRLMIPIECKEAGYTGEELLLGVGKQAARKLISLFKTNETKEWIGSDIELLVVHYPRFRANGFVPVKVKARGKK